MKINIILFYDILLQEIIVLFITFYYTISLVHVSSDFLILDISFNYNIIL